MQKRLEELSWRTQPRSLNNGDRGEVGEVFDSKPGEVMASPPISLKAHQQKKIAQSQWSLLPSASGKLVISILKSYRALPPPEAGLLRPKRRSLCFNKSSATMIQALVHEEFPDASLRGPSIQLIQSHLLSPPAEGRDPFFQWHNTPK
jgi:hypothetical protein